MSGRQRRWRYGNMHEADAETIDTQEADAPRCLDCAYCLFGLADSRCPECGRPFDLTDPSTFSTKPPLVRWRLWLPGLLVATGMGVVTFLVILISPSRPGKSTLTRKHGGANRHWLYDLALDGVAIRIENPSR